MNYSPDILQSIETRRNEILVTINELQLALDEATSSMEILLSLLEDGKHSTTEVSGLLVPIDIYALPGYIRSLNSRISQLVDEYVSLQS